MCTVSLVVDAGIARDALLDLATPCYQCWWFRRAFTESGDG